MCQSLTVFCWTYLAVVFLLARGCKDNKRNGNGIFINTRGDCYIGSWLVRITLVFLCNTCNRWYLLSSIQIFVVASVCRMISAKATGITSGKRVTDIPDTGR